MTAFSSSKKEGKYHPHWHTFGFYGAALAMWEEATSLVPEGITYSFMTINAQTSSALEEAHPVPHLLHMHWQAPLQSLNLEDHQQYALESVSLKGNTVVSVGITPKTVNHEAKLLARSAGNYMQHNPREATSHPGTETSHKSLPLVPH
jgi:hypothetical protein